MKDSTQFSEFTIDISKIPEGAAQKLEASTKAYDEQINRLGREAPLELDSLKAQSQALAVAANNYRDPSGQNLEASDLDSDRYASITIIKPDGTEIKIDNFSKKAREHYGQESATMEMLVDYLREVDPKINIADSQKKFLKDQWHQSGPPSLAGTILSSPAAPEIPQRVFRIDDNNNLASAEYIQTYNSIDGKQKSGTFTVKADLSTNTPKTSVKYKSKNGLAISMGKDIVEAMGPAISTKTIYNAPRRMVELAARKAGRLVDFMKRQSQSMRSALPSFKSRSKENGSIGR